MRYNNIFAYLHRVRYFHQRSKNNAMKTISEFLKWNKNIKTSTFQSVLRIVLGLFLLYAGISHLSFAREEFVAQVPHWVHLADDLVVVLSGIVEISLGFSLVFLAKWKAIIGWATALFFVLIFPGNIAQYVNQIDAFGLDTDQARLIRLFFQPVLVAWALWANGAIKAYKQKKI